MAELQSQFPSSEFHCQDHNYELDYTVQYTLNFMSHGLVNRDHSPHSYFRLH